MVDKLKRYCIQFAVVSIAWISISGCDRKTTLIERLANEVRSAYREDNLEEAFDKAVQLNKQARQKKDDSHRAYSHFYLGRIYLRQGVLDSSYYNYQNAAHLYYEIGDKINLSATYVDCAKVLNLIEDQATAERFARKALKILGDPPMSYPIYAEAQSALSDIYLALSEYDESVEFENAVYQIPKKYLSPIARVSNRYRLARIFLDQGKYLGAERWLREAEEISLSAKLPDFVLRQIYNSFSDCMRLQRNFGRAEFYTKKALDLLSSGTPADSVRTYIRAAMANPNISESYLRQADEIAMRAKSLELRKEVFKAFVDCSHPKAQFFANEYVKAQDSIDVLDRRLQNRYGRIRYRHDELLSERDDAGIERIYYSVLALILMSIVVSLFILRTEKNKRRELEIVNLQGIINEKVSKLISEKDREIEKARQKENQRIASEINTDIINRLRSIKESLRNPDTPYSPDTDAPEIKPIQQIEFDVRRLAHELNDEIFSENVSFNSLIKSIFDELKNQCGATFFLEVDEKINWETTPQYLKVDIYRLLQVLLGNRAVTQPRNVFVTIVPYHGAIRIIVIDDGRGTDFTTDKNGRALRETLKRILKNGGSFDNKPRPGKGTTIIVTLPQSK